VDRKVGAGHIQALVQADPAPEPADARVVHLPLDERSLAAQQKRDGRVDRFHATTAGAQSFAAEARDWVADGVFYRLDTAGVRSYWPGSPLERPLTQTLDDLAIGYGGPVGYAVTAVDGEGWRRVQVAALGTVTYARWRVGTGAQAATGPSPGHTLGR
jgi:hypothetical protein